MKKFMLGLLIGLLMLPVAALVLLLNGKIRLDASADHPGWFNAVMHMAYEQAVEQRAASLQRPADYPDAYGLQRGARSFADMCAGCHTAPGARDTATRLGLNPPPPVAADLGGHFSTEQLYSVIDRGVFMTGMPAFGPSHDAAEVWHLTRFVEALAGMDAAAYQRLTRPVPGQQDDHGGHHSHSHGESQAMGQAAAQQQPTPPAEPKVPAGHEGHDHAH